MSGPPALRLGLIVNPLAGIGGSAALKGSDGDIARNHYRKLDKNGRSRSQSRSERALRPLANCGSTMEVLCWDGTMGADVARAVGFQPTVIGEVSRPLSAAEDTRDAAADLVRHGVDMIVFCGGDGTARDVLDIVGTKCPVLGIPAGVKMHSGVFAVSPEAAGELLVKIAAGGLVDLRTVEIRDIDEDAFRQNIVRSRFYGELLAPADGQYLQQTKVGGRENVELVASEIAAWFADHQNSDCTYIIGPGSTTAAVKQALGTRATLLGVDVIRNGSLLLEDATAEELLQLLAHNEGPVQLVATAIGGQGHLFGRGNQQFTPAVIRAVGQDNLCVVAAKSKITGLQGRPLLVDTNDPALDRELAGLITILTGYDDRILYRVGQ